MTISPVDKKRPVMVFGVVILALTILFCVVET
jgi:hypothetical protein